MLLLGILAVTLIHNTLSIPDGWKFLGSQQTTAEVERLVPEIETTLRGVKADFAYHDCLLGKWILAVTYDEHGYVQNKLLSFRLGTKKHFKEYFF